MALLLVKRGKKYGFGRAEVVILFRVTQWFNGVRYEIRGQKRWIGNSYEPPLRQLCGDEWELGFDEVHQRLIDNGVFKSRERDESVHIAGRQCRWIPTDRAMTVIEDIFDDQDGIYPRWAGDDHTRPPTFRDGPELMEHRKGVLASAYQFQSVDQSLSADIYPKPQAAVRPDLILRANERVARVEVLTNHRNTDSWQRKFSKWSEDTLPTIWIFENRKNMVRFWNYLMDCGYIELDGGRFGGEPNNWSPRRVNDRLRRSRRDRPADVSRDFVWTIPGVVGATRHDVFQFFKRNRI